MQDALPDIALDQIGRFRSAMSVLSMIRARIEPDPAPRSGPKRPDFETSDFCRAQRAFAKREIRWPAWHWGVESAKGSNAMAKITTATRIPPLPSLEVDLVRAFLSDFRFLIYRNPTHSRSPLIDRI